MMVDLTIDIMLSSNQVKKFTSDKIYFYHETIDIKILAAVMQHWYPTNALSAHAVSVLVITACAYNLEQVVTLHHTNLVTKFAYPKFESAFKCCLD